MSEHLDLFHLLAHGRLPISAIDPTMLPNSMTPVFRAFEYVMSKPHVFPLSVKDVAAVSSTRFHAKTEAKEFFTQLSQYKPSDVKIETVQQAILLRKVVSTAQDQLVTGKYDLTKVGSYTSHVSSFGASTLVKTVAPIEKINEEASNVNYITGIDVIDNLLGSIRDELVVVSARPKNGKALQVDTPVLTPDGWKRIGDIVVGDKVIGSDGQATSVTNTMTWVDRPCYKIVWKDGASVVADSEHDWAVYKEGRKRKQKLLTTAKLYRSKQSWSTPVPQTIDHPEKMLPVNPYLLGLLIGDGCLTNTGVKLSVSKQCVIDKVRAVSVHSVNWNNNQMVLAGGKHDMRKAMSVLGLAGKGAHDKFLPSEYMFATAKDRHALLEGLMDSDGYVGKSGQAEYYTVSQNLARGVQRLVWSLGGESKIAKKIQDEVISYRVSVCLPQYRSGKSVSRRISSVAYAGNQATTCIEVEAGDGLYVCKDYILTHNSNFFINLVDKSPNKAFLYVVICDYGYASLCQAMYDCNPAILKRKNVWIADFNSFAATAIDVESVIREYKPDVVIVDRAEEMPSLAKNKDERQDLKIIFKAMRQLAKKYKVPLFVDAQQSDTGEQFMKQNNFVSPDYMAGDRTGRLATLDLFFGLQRRGSTTKIHLFGRRKSLPSNVEVRTNNMGRYL